MRADKKFSIVCGCRPGLEEANHISDVHQRNSVLTLFTLEKFIRGNSKIFAGSVVCRKYKDGT